MDDRIYKPGLSLFEQRVLYTIVHFYEKYGQMPPFWWLRGHLKRSPQRSLEKLRKLGYLVMVELTDGEKPRKFWALNPEVYKFVVYDLEDRDDLERLRNDNVEHFLHKWENLPKGQKYDR